jgi:hypothetical protein
MSSYMKILFKRILILLVGGYFIYGGLRPCASGLMNSADLLFHEGGHVIFGAFGEYFGMWGGTLMQLLIPAIVVVHFFRHGDDFSARVVLCWLGQNFFHIAPYIKDARAQALPLVGGGIHDWHYILGRAGLLNSDQWIGNTVWWVGLAVIAHSVFMGLLSAGESQGTDE